jgi:hypothetical protein
MERRSPGAPEEYWEKLLGKLCYEAREEMKVNPPNSLKNQRVYKVYRSPCVKGAGI